jgi:hypothetical protein
MHSSHSVATFFQTLVWSATELWLSLNSAAQHTLPLVLNAMSAYVRGAYEIFPLTWFSSLGPPTRLMEDEERLFICSWLLGIVTNFLILILSFLLLVVGVVGADKVWFRFSIRVIGLS